MMVEIDDKVILQAIREAMTGRPPYYESTAPIFRVAAMVVKASEAQLTEVCATALADVLNDPAFRAGLTATMREAVTTAMVAKVNAAVRAMPAADVRQSAGALFSEMVPR